MFLKAKRMRIQRIKLYLKFIPILTSFASCVSIYFDMIFDKHRNKISGSIELLDQ